MPDETRIDAAFEGVVRRAYSIDAEHVVLVFERYAGDVDIGESLAVTPTIGTSSVACVTSVAWGSAFHADDPPLTLVVAGLKGDAEYAGATVMRVATPGAGSRA